MAADETGGETVGGTATSGTRAGFAPWSKPNARPLLRLEGIGKKFGDIAAVEQLSLDIHEGEFFALLGPSGCGKTTLLRLLAGFEQPSEGRILLDGEDIAGVPPHRRPVNMMFQSYALFPHLTVAGNVAFGLRQEALPREEIDARVNAMLALVKLDGLGARKPHQLSGGQRQRVALARALVKRPRAFLLDEPLAALDRKLREETRFELMELQRKLGLTFIIVTHDQEEAMILASRIGVMDRGRLVQVATPPEIYEQPNSRWVADFIGDVNLIEGQLASAGPEAAIVSFGAGRLRAAQAVDAPLGAVVWLALRPEKVRIAAADSPEASENVCPGRIVEIGYLGDVSIYKVKLDSGLIMKAAVANLARQVLRSFSVGDRVTLSWPADAGVVLIQ